MSALWLEVPVLALSACWTSREQTCALEYPRMSTGQNRVRYRTQFLSVIRNARDADPATANALATMKVSWNLKWLSDSVSSCMLGEGEPLGYQISLSAALYPRETVRIVGEDADVRRVYWTQDLETHSSLTCGLVLEVCLSSLHRR